MRSSALTVVLMMSTLAVFGQTPKIKTTYYPATPLPGVKPSGPMMAMPSIAPLFIQDDRMSSSLMLVNNASQSAGATITIRDLQGRLVVESHVVLERSSQQEFPFTELLSSARQYVSAGNVTVLQDHELQGAAVNAQLLIKDLRNTTPGYLDEELAMPSMEGSSILRGVTDSSNGAALLAIANLSEKKQSVTVTCLIATDRLATASITIPPHGTSLTAACSTDPIADVDSYVRSVSGNERVQVLGIEVAGSAGPGTLASFAFAPHTKENEIVLSAVPFTDPKAQVSSSTIYTGVPFGLQTVLSDSVYVPHIALANFSDKKANVTIAVSNSGDRDVRDGLATKDLSTQSQLHTLVLEAKETRAFVLGARSGQSGLTHSITITSDQLPGQLESKIVSRGNGTLYEVELLGKDSKNVENGGGHPWTTRGDSQSDLLLFNHSAKQAPFTVHIAAGEKIWTKQYMLVPEETRDLSINRLVGDNIKDDSGQVIGSAHRDGVVYWSVPDPGNGSGRLLVSSRATNSARNFSCGYTNVVCGLGVSVSYSGFIPLLGDGLYANSFGQFCLAWGPGSCGGGTQTSGGSANFQWTLGDTSVVSFNTSADQYSNSPNLYGNNPGGTWAVVSATENGCSANGSGSPAPTVQQPDHLSVVSDNFIPYGCNAGSSLHRDVNYNVLDLSQQVIVRPISVLETVNPSTQSSCNGYGLNTTYACRPIASGNFTDSLDPGCPATAQLANGCGYTFPQQVWEWCNPQPVSPVSIGDIGQDIVHNNYISLGGNSTGFSTGQTFPH